MWKLYLAVQLYMVRCKCAYMYMLVSRGLFLAFRPVHRVLQGSASIWGF